MQAVDTGRSGLSAPGGVKRYGAVAILLAAAVAITILAGRAFGTAAPAFSSSVVPAAGSYSAGSAAGSGADRQASAALGAAPAPAPAAQGSSFPVGGGCISAPTVQFQGRGLSATGTGVVAGSGAAGPSMLNLSVQERGTDAATVLALVQSRLAAVTALLRRSGVGEGDIRSSYFNGYQDPMSKQFSASASLQATLKSDQVAEVSRNVLQAGVTSYSVSAGSPSEASAGEIQSAVSAAAAQARDMAAATAKAVGVTLGPVESVVAQPPVQCYLSGGPARIVQVTATYALR